MMRRPLLPLASAAALALLAGSLGAQAGGSRPCVPDFSPTNPRGVPSNIILLPSGNRNVFQGGGVLYRCQGQNVEIVADSLEAYGDLQQVILVGNVRYRDDDATVTSDQMTWNEVDQWLLAQGNVYAVTTDGSTMRGPFAEYYRAIPTLRPVQRLRAVGRPTLTLVQKDSAGRSRPPVVVIANEITTLGDSLVYAGGQVEITRTDALARSDSATVDEQRGYARLMRDPRIDGRGKRPFTLTGTVIDLFTRERQLERVLSMGEAHSVSQDVDLRSDTLDLRLIEGELQHAVAWGASRAHARSPRQDIEADSLDIRMPGQRMREVFAIGTARVESDPDSTSIRSSERDWLLGDTVVARFDTLAPPSDSGSPPIRELIAIVDARSFQQIAPDTGITDRPSLHYVRGRRIEVYFEPGQGPQRVVVTAPDSGQTVGVYLDASDSAAAAPPAAGAPPPVPPASPSTGPTAGGGVPRPAPTTRPSGSRPPR